MISNIKDALIDAKRYKSVMSILRHIAEFEDRFYTVPPFVDIIDETAWGIHGVAIAAAAKNLIRLINGKGTNRAFIDLRIYVNSEVNIMLRNFANDISHRKYPHTDMNEIRKWQTLLHILNCLDYYDNNGEVDFTVPECWKK